MNCITIIAFAVISNACAATGVFRQHKQKNNNTSASPPLRFHQQPERPSFNFLRRSSPPQQPKTEPKADRANNGDNTMFFFSRFLRPRAFETRYFSRINRRSYQHGLRSNSRRINRSHYFLRDVFGVRRDDDRLKWHSRKRRDVSDNLYHELRDMRSTSQKINPYDRRYYPRDHDYSADYNDGVQYLEGYDQVVHIVSSMIMDYIYSLKSRRDRWI